MCIYLAETINHLRLLVYGRSPIWHLAPLQFVVLRELPVLLETLPWLPAPCISANSHRLGPAMERGRSVSPQRPVTPLAFQVHFGWEMGTHFHSLLTKTDWAG